MHDQPHESELKPLEEPLLHISLPLEDQPRDSTEPMPQSYLDILAAKDPQAAFATIAHDDELVSTMRFEAEKSVAEAAVETQLGLNTKEEKIALQQRLEQYEGFLGIMLIHNISEMRTTHSEGEIKKYVAQKILSSHETILTLENQISKNRSFKEQMKEILAADRVRRVLAKTAIAGGGAGLTYLGIKYGMPMLPKETEEAIRENASPEVLGALIGMQFGWRRAGDKFTDKLTEEINDEALVGVTEHGRKKTAEHLEQLEETESRLFKVAGKDFFDEKAYSSEMVFAMLLASHDLLTNAYKAATPKEAGKRAVVSVSKAVAAGLASILGVNQEVAKQIFEEIPEY